MIRLKICYNLTRAIDLLHGTGNYIIVDLKPENVLVKPNGHFSLIDLDSIQISHNKQLLYHATAYTTEYAPPEFHRGNLVFHKNIITTSFDCFSFAVILYQILLSIHPFQASHKVYTTIAENIKHGLFVYGGKRNQLLVISPAHQNFNKLPQSIKSLFIRALEHGDINPLFRPAAKEWAQVLINIIAMVDKNTMKRTLPAMG